MKKNTTWRDKTIIKWKEQMGQPSCGGQSSPVVITRDAYWRCHQTNVKRHPFTREQQWDGVHGSNSGHALRPTPARQLRSYIPSMRLSKKQTNSNQPDPAEQQPPNIRSPTPMVGWAGLEGMNLGMLGA